MTNLPPNNHIRRGRETARKRLLRELLESHAEQGILLDEARWEVERAKLADCVDEDASRSIFNSFARTVREQLPEYAVQKVSVSPATPLGLLARAAVYRIRDVVALRRFLGARRACILCRYKTNLNVDEPHYEPTSRYVVPHFHAATFRFFDNRPSKVTYDQLEKAPGTFIPATQKLTVIVRQGTTASLSTIATVPWKLFGYADLDDWFEVDGTDALKSVHRNRF